MTVSSSDRAHGDLLDSGGPETVDRRPSRFALLATAVAVVLAGALVSQQMQGEDPEAVALQDMSGSLTLSGFRSTTVASPFEGSQERQAHGSGSVHLELTGGELDGLAAVDFSGSFQGSLELRDDGPASAHLWGDVWLAFGSIECKGSFGWSNFTEPAESGGSLHARCQDGATLAATLVATAPEGPQRLTIDLREGWYVAGAAKDD